MTETVTGTNRSAGPTYQDYLDIDSHPVRDILRVDSPMEPGPTLVPVERYFSQEFHDLEVEKVWKRVWQMACHEDDIPDVGDHLVYDIAHLSFLVVRTGPTRSRPTGMRACTAANCSRANEGKWAKDLRCSFHGWCWNLDGTMKEIPCQWDFRLRRGPTRAPEPPRSQGWPLGRLRLHQPRSRCRTARGLSR